MGGGIVLACAAPESGQSADSLGGVAASFDEEAAAVVLTTADAPPVASRTGSSWIGVGDAGAVAAEDDVSVTKAALTSNGCSIPLYAEAIQQVLHPFPGSVSKLFRRGCDRHDYCYSSGKAFYGFSRESCDDRFFEDLAHICYDEYSVLNPVLPLCIAFATEFYGVVRGKGASHFENGPCTAGQVDTEQCSSHEPFENGAPISKDLILYTTNAGSTFQRAGTITVPSTKIGNTAAALAGYAFRVGVLEGNTLRLEEGDPDVSQTFSVTDVSRFALSGNRIAAVFTDRDFFLRSGGLNSTWTSGVGSVYNFALDKDRVVIATSQMKNGVRELGVWFKKGPASSAWKPLNPVDAQLNQIAIAGSRIAVIYNASFGPTAMVSDNDGLTWNFINSTDGVLDVTRFARIMDQLKVAGGRMAVRAYSDGSWNLWVTDGRLDSFLRVGNNVMSWDLLPNRLAMVTGGRLILQDLKGATVDVGTASTVKLSGNRVAFVDGGKLFVKEGTVSAAWSNRNSWTQIDTNVKDFAIWQKGDYDFEDYVDVIH